MVGSKCVVVPETSCWRIVGNWYCIVGTLDWDDRMWVWGKAWGVVCEIRLYWCSVTLCCCKWKEIGKEVLVLKGIGGGTGVEVCVVVTDDGKYEHCGRDAIEGVDIVGLAVIVVEDVEAFIQGPQWMDWGIATRVGIRDRGGAGVVSGIVDVLFDTNLEVYNSTKICDMLA